MSQQNSVSLSRQGLKEIVEGTSAETGEGFFDALVQHLARAIGTKCAWVTELIADQRSLRALSFWAGDGYIADFEYAIADTPCASVIENRRLIPRIDQDNRATVGYIVVRYTEDTLTHSRI